MVNEEIAEIFEQMAGILEERKENPFKINAYRKAAKLIRSLEDDLTTLAEKDELTKLSGIGKALSEKIKEYIKTGQIQAFEKLKNQSK